MKQIFLFLLLLPVICFAQTRTNGTGTGSIVYATSPTLVTPALGTPSAIVLTNATGFPTLNQSTTGSAATLTTSRNINSVAFNGSADITVTAAAGTLTGATLNSGVTASSLTSFGSSPSFTTPNINAATGTSLVLSSFLNEAKGADIASATTTDIGAATGNYVDVTGTVTITGLGTVQAGTRRIVKFTGALTLTHNATSLILPGSANITTVAGDVAIFNSLGSGNWQCVAYSKISTTGTGSSVFATSPTFVTPTLGAATATTLNGHTFTAGSSTFTGTAAAVYTFPAATKTISANDGSNWTISGQAIGDIPVASSTTAYGKLASVAAGSYLRSNGAGAAPVYSTLTLPNTIATGEMLVATATNVISAQNTRENWTTFVVSGSNATTTGQTLVDITGLTSGTLTAATLYEVEAWLNVTTSAVTTGTQYAIFANGTGGAAIYNALITGTSTVNAAISVTQSSATQQGTFLTTSASSGVIYIHGFITTRGSGTPTISIQHLKVTSGTSTVLIGSKMKIRLAN